MHELLQALESNTARRVQAAVAQLATRPELPPAVLALGAVAWHRWDPKASAELNNRHHYQECQAIHLGWRAPDDWDAADSIQESLAQLLQRHLPALPERAALLGAARLFNYAYPVDIYIGNGDAGGYSPDCRALWQDFAPWQAWFAAALPLSEALRREWITVAQIFWYHCRWQPDDEHDGTFSEPACAYLLAQAVVLNSAYPIQYYRLYAQRPCSDGGAVPTGGQELTLQSGLGTTYFYYAHFCQYHLQDFDLALAFYRQFLAAEPHCLPDNGFRLFSRDATQRSYPPSTQEALTEMGTLYVRQGQLEAARQAFEQAIAQRPDNFQAPYERLADLLMQQGDLAAALPYLSRKADVCTRARLCDYGWRTTGVPTYLHYDPAAQVRLVVDADQYDFSMSDPSTRVRVYYVGELYKQLADAYFYELYDYQQAAPYYKKYLAYLDDRPKNSPAWLLQRVDAAESQIRLVMDQGDYWQARTLSEKLLRIAPDNGTAPRYLAQIRQRLGY